MDKLFEGLSQLLLPLAASDLVDFLDFHFYTMKLHQLIHSLRVNFVDILPLILK
jgi:hypothetical protein